MQLFLIGKGTTAKMTRKVLDIAREFSPYPAGRYPSDGPFSGERFRSQLLQPLFLQCRKSGDKLLVELDGTAGYGSSFLEESFGGLVRSTQLDAAALMNVLEFASEDDSLIAEVTEYIRDASTNLVR